MRARAVIPPYSGSRRLLSLVGAVALQAAATLWMPRAPVQTCAPPPLLANVGLAGEVRFVPDLQPASRSAPARNRRGPHSFCARSSRRSASRENFPASALTIRHRRPRFPGGAPRQLAGEVRRSSVRFNNCALGWRPSWPAFQTITDGSSWPQEHSRARVLTTHVSTRCFSRFRSRGEEPSSSTLGGPTGAMGPSASARSPRL